jgi:flagellar hook-basal body complex protein FliE
MTVSYSEALAAYRRVADQARIQPPGGDDQPAGDVQEFSKVLREATGQAIQEVKQGEQMSLAAAAGQANINDVVMAMSKAEMTLQTVVTLRDKAVQAYQQILRMPI